MNLKDDKTEKVNVRCKPWGKTGDPAEMEMDIDFRREMFVLCR